MDKISYMQCFTHTHKPSRQLGPQRVSGLLPCVRHHRPCVRSSRNLEVAREFELSVVAPRSAPVLTVVLQVVTKV
jgi:hypothetical protein